MSYLRIKNPGVAPIESFTTLGLSTSNDGNSKGIIGQFGTGNKHAVNTLLRNDKSPIVYLGDTKVEFASLTRTVHAPDGSHIYEQATIIVDGEERELGYTLDFGHHDWNEISMALREFISNAIDMTIKLHGTFAVPELDIRIVKQIEPVEGCTSVFIPVDDHVKKYMHDISKYFLHFSGQQLHYGTMERGSLEPCRLYREGVFVTEIKQRSVFDYNFNSNEMRIDECRNLDSYRARNIIGKHMENFDVADAKIILQKIKDGVECLEIDLMEASWKLESEKISCWEEAVSQIFTENDIATVSAPTVVAALIDARYNPIICSSTMVKVLKEQGMRTHKDVLTYAESKGYTLVEPNQMDRNVEYEVWEGLNVETSKPDVKYFTEESSKQYTGFVKDGIVYVNDDYRGENKQLRMVLVDMYVRYLSGCTPDSLNYRKFLCALIVDMIK